MVIENAPFLERLLVSDLEGPTKIRVIDAPKLTVYSSAKFSELFIGSVIVQVQHSSSSPSSWNSHFLISSWCIYDRLPENDSHKLDPVYAHSEDLGNKIYRPQSGSSCWIPYMLSVHGEATHRGETSFLLVNGNHNVAQFFRNFPKLRWQV